MVVVFKVVIVVVTTAFLAGLINEAVKSANPGKDSPLWGKATITHCGSGHPPECYGDFVSSNGEIRRSNVRIWYADGYQAGTTVRAYADTADRDVTHPGGQDILMNIAGFFFVSLVWLASVGWLFGPGASRWHMRRRLRHGLGSERSI